MMQTERRNYLIAALLKERPEYSEIEIPEREEEQKALLRSLLNLRPPAPVTDEFLTIQDAYLQEETRRKGITNVHDLQPLQPGLYLWQGDITTLKCDAIVNAANAGMLGCFCPNHGCIDNAIHTYAGVQLRLACAEFMRRQGCWEETGKARITPAYNLPSRYILHTVGPVIAGRVRKSQEEQLASCYRSCLALAAEKGVESIAFCCISTGEFHFPNRRAAEIAVRTVRGFRAQTNSKMEVIFNVFREQDFAIYRRLLAEYP
ncbi:MAG TPA: protein-ADP-ribose hydrolase [Candidatus Faecousia intestinigallinarum]|nr:protein-ADP-ribose hydrolase [Candidatus Faecousia intestinigallinarum]